MAILKNQSRGQLGHFGLPMFNKEIGGTLASPSTPIAMQPISVVLPPIIAPPKSLAPPVSVAPPPVTVTPPKSFAPPISFTPPPTVTPPTSIPDLDAMLGTPGFDSKYLWNIDGQNVALYDRPPRYIGSFTVSDAGDAETGVYSTNLALNRILLAGPTMVDGQTGFDLTPFNGKKYVLIGPNRIKSLVPPLQVQAQPPPVQIIPQPGSGGTSVLSPFQPPVNTLPGTNTTVAPVNTGVTGIGLPAGYQLPKTSSAADQDARVKPTGQNLTQQLATPGIDKSLILAAMGGLGAGWFGYSAKGPAVGAVAAVVVFLGVQKIMSLTK